MKINVVHPEAIDAYLLELAGGEETLGRYLSIALKNAMMKEKSFFNQVTAYPEDAPAWLTREKFEEGFYFEFSPEQADGKRNMLRHIKDWIGGAIKDGDAWIENTDALGRPIRLLQISTLQKAQDMADKDMRAKANNLRSRFLNASSLFEEDEAAGHIETVKIFDDGSRIVRLLTPHALDIESAHLGHCIGNGNYDDYVQSEDCFYYSLRDPLNKAHATFEVEKGTLLQLKGRENAPPAEKYMGKAQEFIRENKWKLGEDIINTGLLHKDGEYYDIQNLPEGFAWDEELLLQNIPWLKGLSDGMTIRSNVYLEYCPKFSFIGDNVSVSGDLVFREIYALTTIGNNVSVGGDLDIKKCESITRIGDNVSVGKDLILPKCIKLNSIGKNISVGGVLEITNCKTLVSLSDNISVSGNMHAGNLPALTSIGKNLSVGKNLFMDHCTALIYIGENLTVVGDLDLRRCTALTCLPENLSVGGYLDLRGCTALTSLPQNFSAQEISWNGEVYETVAAFRAAFEAVHPPKPSAPPPPPPPPEAPMPQIM